MLTVLINLHIIFYLLSLKLVLLLFLLYRLKKIGRTGLNKESQTHISELKCFCYNREQGREAFEWADSWIRKCECVMGTTVQRAFGGSRKQSGHWRLKNWWNITLMETRHKCGKVHDLCGENSKQINVISMEGSSFIQLFCCSTAIMCRRIRHGENNTKCAGWNWIKKTF